MTCTLSTMAKVKMYSHLTALRGLSKLVTIIPQLKSEVSFSWVSGSFLEKAVFFSLLVTPLTNKKESMHRGSVDRSNNWTGGESKRVVIRMLDSLDNKNACELNVHRTSTDGPRLTMVRLTISYFTKVWRAPRIQEKTYLQVWHPYCFQMFPDVSRCQ